MKNIYEINQLVTRMEQRLKSGSSILQELPEGHLSYQKQNGCPVIVNDYETDGMRHRQVLTNKTEYAAALLHRELLETELASLKKDIKILKDVEKRLSDYNIDDEIRKVRQRIPVLNDELIQRALRDPRQNEWENAPYEKNQFRQEELKNKLLV